MAVKDTYVEDQDWDDKYRWRGDVDDLEHRIPLEVDAHTELGRTDSDKVVRLVNWKNYPRKQMYRIWMELCPRGTMEWVRRHYDRDGQAKIPEPSLRHLFGSLVDVAILMETGALDIDEEAVRESYVHRDMKPENVFQVDYSATHFAAYPTPKLGNFGLAIRLDAEFDLIMNPVGVNNGTGSRGFVAPEQSARIFEQNGASQPQLKSWIHVWGIGITLLSLINLVAQPPAQTHRNDDDPVSPGFTAYGNRYSEALRNTVQHRSAGHPAERPDLALLRQIIDHCTKPPTGNPDEAEDRRSGRYAELNSSRLARTSTLSRH